MATENPLTSSQFHWGYIEFENMLASEPHVGIMANMTPEEKKIYIKKVKEEFIAHKLEEDERKKLIKDLKIKVIRGENLAAKDRDGLSDPYCEIFFHNKKFKTTVLSNTLNPAWNETFEIGQFLSEDIVTVYCWDKNLLSADFEGKFQISLSEFKETGKFTKIYNLEAREGKKEKVTGTIEVEIYINVIEKEKLTPEVKRETRRQATFIKQGKNATPKKTSKKLRKKRVN